MKTLSDLKVAIFADGAEKAGMLEMYAKPYIKGFTTNPTLMRKAGVSDYEKFAREILHKIPDRPISFEVFADDFPEMARQARKIATWGKNIRVKIPITNTRRESAVPLCEELTQEGIPLNVTALFTLEQVEAVVDAVKGGAPTYVSVFAGRIADSGVDPVPLMAEAARRRAAGGWRGDCRLRQSQHRQVEIYRVCKPTSEFHLRPWRSSRDAQLDGGDARRPPRRASCSEC